MFIIFDKDEYIFRLGGGMHSNEYLPSMWLYSLGLSEARSFIHTQYVNYSSICSQILVCQLGSGFSL